MREIMKFFSAYDASRDLSILILKKHYHQKKKENQKIKTYQAYDFSEKSEIESLFLSSLDACKREHYKNQNSRPGLKSATTLH